MAAHRKPRKVRTLSDVEAAWVGAMIDGEGSIYRCVGRSPYRMDFANTEVELVATMLRLVGSGCVGYVNGKPSERRAFIKHIKDAWRWYLYPINDIAALLEQIAPYSIKAQKWLPDVLAFAGTKR